MRKLRALRLESGLSVESLADRIDVHRNTLYLLERGVSNAPTKRVAAKLEAWFDLPVAELLEELPDGTDAATGQQAPKAGA